MVDENLAADSAEGEAYWQLHHAYEKAVYDARTGGMSWPQIAASGDIFKAWSNAHPNWPVHGRGLSLGQVKSAYARHCKRLSVDSDGPTQRKQETMWKAVLVLAAAGWDEQAIASAFGINVKSVRYRLKQRQRNASAFLAN